MKKIVSFLLLAATACLLFACADEGKPIDISFEALEEVLAEANALKEAELVTESAVKVHYEQSSLKKYDVDSSQKSKTSFRRSEDGTLFELNGDYTVKTKEEASFSVYYKDGMAYYSQGDRRYKEATDVSAIDDRSLFLSFAKDEVENYSARIKKGVITVTFTVPWESTSDKAVELYSQLASAMQATGLEVKDVTYKDLSASYSFDEATGKLMRYTYRYEAEMKVDGKKVTVKGSASCTVSKTENVKITAPDLTLYQ